jgi:hypothetical protein
MLPDQPWREKGEGVQSFAHGLRGEQPRLAPPFIEGGVVIVGRLAGHA